MKGVEDPRQGWKVAFVITNGSDEDFYQHARQYFGMFPRQQVQPGRFLRSTPPVVEIGPDANSTPWSFQSLAYNTMITSIQRGRDKDAVIVCHGSFTGQCNVTLQGLHVPLTDQTQIDTVKAVLDVLEPLLNDPIKSQDTNSLSQMERTRGLPSGTLINLFNVLVELRFERLNRAVILACQLGTDTTLLAQFGRCLGCKFISAPDSDVYFGQINVPAATGPRRFAPTGNVAGWVASRPGARLFQAAGGATGSLGMQMVPVPCSHQANWNFAADSRNLAWFANQFFMPTSLLGGTPPPAAYVFPFHVIRDGATLNFLLPGETAYARHLVEVGPLIGWDFRLPDVADTTTAS